MKLLVQAFLFMFVLPLSVMAAGWAAGELAPELFQGDYDARAVCFRGSRYICD